MIGFVIGGGVMLIGIIVGYGLCAATISMKERM